MTDDDASPENIPGPSVPADAISKELLIINKRGLHARASAKFVQMVERFSAEVWVTRGSETGGGTGHHDQSLRDRPRGSRGHRGDHQTRREQVQRRGNLEHDPKRGGHRFLLATNAERICASWSEMAIRRKAIACRLTSTVAG